MPAMPFDLKIEAGADATYLRMGGVLDAAAAERLKMTLLTRLTSNGNDVVIDCADMQSVVAAGLRVFREAATHFHGGRVLRLENVPVRLRAQLRMVDLDHLVVGVHVTPYERPLADVAPA